MSRQPEAVAAEALRQPQVAAEEAWCQRPLVQAAQAALAAQLSQRQEVPEGLAVRLSVQAALPLPLLAQVLWLLQPLRLSLLSCLSCDRPWYAALRAAWQARQPLPWRRPSRRPWLFQRQLSYARPCHAPIGLHPTHRHDAYPWPRLFQPWRPSCWLWRLPWPFSSAQFSHQQAVAGPWGLPPIPGAARWSLRARAQHKAACRSCWVRAWPCWAQARWLAAQARCRKWVAAAAWAAARSAAPADIPPARSCPARAQAASCPAGAQRAQARLRQAARESFPARPYAIPRACRKMRRRVRAWDCCALLRLRGCFRSGRCQSAGRQWGNYQRKAINSEAAGARCAWSPPAARAAAKGRSQTRRDHKPGRRQQARRSSAAGKGLSSSVRGTGKGGASEKEVYLRVSEP